MIPAFAVVGHPNKGKSSIVSTVAQNDSIPFSQQAGLLRTCSVSMLQWATAAIFSMTPQAFSVQPGYWPG